MSGRLLYRFMADAIFDINDPQSMEDKMRENWNNEADITWIDPKKPMVAISFDDGPVDPVSETSPAIRIQNALRDSGMHATFFYWGNTFNEGTRAEIERAQELGFEIANHTKSHPHLPELSVEEMKAEVDFMLPVLKEISGREKVLLRPPYLDVNDTLRDMIDVPLISCGLDSMDWAQATAKQMIDKIAKACENDSLDGKVVLMHETYDATAEAVEFLVPYLKAKGYQVVTISEMFKARGKDMQAGHVYGECPQ